MARIPRPQPLREGLAARVAFKTCQSGAHAELLVRRRATDAWAVPPLLTCRQMGNYHFPILVRFLTSASRTGRHAHERIRLCGGRRRLGWLRARGATVGGPGHAGLAARGRGARALASGRDPTPAGTDGTA